MWLAYMHELKDRNSQNEYKKNYKFNFFHFKDKDPGKLKIKGCRKIYYANSN